MTPRQNDILCRVEGKSPMGTIMRRHWLPACMSEELAERDGAPLRVRLLGEDLVLFRDSEGRIGALDERCPHRGASLAFGRNEDCGLRCLYHGWKFDVTGQAVDLASEPPTAKLRTSMAARAWPTHEAGGFVWVWLGDPGAVVPFVLPLWAQSPDANIAIVKMHAACNWAQVLEGSIDSAHSSSLHSSNMPQAIEVSGSTATGTAWLRPSADKSPRLDVDVQDWGFRYAAIRVPLSEPERQDYVRTTMFVAPFTVHIPPNDRYRLSQMLVPIDDTNCMFYWIAWHPDPDKGISAAEWRAFCGAEPGKDVDPLTFRKHRNLENNYLQDGALLKQGDFTGIYGIPTQDMAMWESMGPIADRSKDRLGSSDKAIVAFRRQMLRAAQAAEKGAIELDGAVPAGLEPFEGMVAKGSDWREARNGT